jgi:hypothetical protein
MPHPLYWSSTRAWHARICEVSFVVKRELNGIYYYILWNEFVIERRLGDLGQ